MHLREYADKKLAGEAIYLSVFCNESGEVDQQKPFGGLTEPLADEYEVPPINIISPERKSN